MTMTVVGVFDTTDHARDAMEDLTLIGLPRADISLMSAPPPATVKIPNDDGANVVVGAGIGAAVGSVGGLLLGLTLLSVPVLGPVLASGPLAAILMGAGIGAATGSLLGALTEIGVPREHALNYAEAVRRGATLVSTRVDDDVAERVAAIMVRHHAIDIRERVASWGQSDAQGQSIDSSESRDITLLPEAPEPPKDSGPAPAPSYVVRQSEVIRVG